MNACVTAVVFVQLFQVLNLWVFTVVYEGWMRGEYQKNCILIRSRKIIQPWWNNSLNLAAKRSEEFRTPEGRKKAYGESNGIWNGRHRSHWRGWNFTRKCKIFFSKEYGIPNGRFVQAQSITTCMETGLTNCFDTAVKYSFGKQLIKSATNGRGAWSVFSYVEVMGKIRDLLQ